MEVFRNALTRTIKGVVHVSNGNIKQLVAYNTFSEDNENKLIKFSIFLFFSHLNSFT